MLLEGSRNIPLLNSLLYLSLFSLPAFAHPNPLGLHARADDPVDKEDPLAYLPAQIGGIVGAYAVSLVLVAITLLALSKRRREHLNSGNEEADFSDVKKEIPEFQVNNVPGPLNIDTQVPPVPHFSYPSPTKGEFDAPNGVYINPSPISTTTIGCPGLSPQVDQRVVHQDRIMAQAQLEEMYKHVMEHEEAKKRGVVHESPIYPNPIHHPRSTASESVTSFGSFSRKEGRKERFKPGNLNLNQGDEERTQSRTSSLLSALRSPTRKKAVKGVTISSPIMTPQSATFPRFSESQEMSSMAPRQYAPPPPPPIPTDQVPFGAVRTAPITPPDNSPQSVQSIDERLEEQLPPPPPKDNKNGHNRQVSLAPTEGDPQSATSEHSMSPLTVGLPQSPKPGARFPALPASPKPGQTFSRANAPSAVRTGGTLPLRAYENALNSPSVSSQTTQQTVFERRGPLSPSGAMTPYTAGVPYSPYQPFTPCVPMTPSLVTREDRRRMKRLVPKTPTVEMVKAAEDIW